jgi:hypothetical protein
MGEWAQVASMIDYRFYLYNLLAVVIGFCGIYWQFKKYFKDIRGDDYEKYQD